MWISAKNELSMKKPKMIRALLNVILLVFTILSCSDDTKQMYSLNVSSNPTEGGTVNPTSGDFEEGTEITIRVSSNTYYEFDKWSGSWSGSESPLTITMDSDKNLVGNFKLMDSDGDGVTDDIDQCNSTPSGQSVDEDGCSDSQKDSDGDGVTDDLDAFPDDPSETMDSDGDGVGDNSDAFPNDASETVDSDGDGVGDNSDACQGTLEGLEVDENGCSDSQKDSDGDGVTDDLDAFPDDPSETVDSDGDGVGDNSDACQGTLEGLEVGENGCIGFQRTIDGTAIDQDGNSFQWINYGAQDWAVENAKVVTYRDGTPIIQTTNSDNEKIGKYMLVYNESSRGLSYNYYAVEGRHDEDETTPKKELAPEGWRVPTLEDFEVLINFLISNGYNYDQSIEGAELNKIGKSMASNNNQNSQFSWNGCGSYGTVGFSAETNNLSGFNAYPNGMYFDGTVFGDLNNPPYGFTGGNIWAFFHTSTKVENNDLLSFSYGLNNCSEKLELIKNGKNNSYSVRFVRDSSSD